MPIQFLVLCYEKIGCRLLTMSFVDGKPGPLGEDARAVLPFMKSLPEETRRALQIESLETFLMSCVKEGLQDAWQGRDESGLRGEFRKVAGAPTDVEKARAILKSFGAGESVNDDPVPLAPMYKLPLNMEFYADVRPLDLCQMAAWKIIHQRARDENYTVVLHNFFDYKAPYQTRIEFRTEVSYEDGRKLKENAGLYPVLPKPPVPPDALAPDAQPREKRPPRRINGPGGSQKT